MTLYKGSKKISPIVNKGLTVRNQDITVTENGVYTPAEGYTGINQVTVNVPVKDLRDVTINVTENNKTLEFTHNDFDGYDKITINANVPIQEKKSYIITKDDLDNSKITVTVDEEFAGMKSIEIDFSELIRILSEI